ncbi:MAG: 3-dehydroquinate synthase [Clostridia bacterium]|nr:3-dehydroquinate synthase [Clostridia bacterium]
MDIVTVGGVKNPYECIIGSGVSSLLPEKIASLTSAKKVLLITDDNVDLLYGEKVKSLIEEGGFMCHKFVFPHGEEHKNLTTVSQILEFAAENELSRSDCIIALGGGIVGDVAGFCASCFLRGIDYIQMPTTFLSAIDSSVGGKTGVNLKQGKNLAGAFYQPKAVICDTDFLSTLSPEIFMDGTAEAIKYGVLFDEELFNKFKTDFKRDISSIIKRCISFKAEVVKKDEFDTGLRQLLNFGHTIGHAIEKCSDFEISHGKAVAIGMVMAARGGAKTGLIKDDFSKEIASVNALNGLPVSADFSAEALLEAMLRDKKRSADNITLVLP